MFPVLLMVSTQVVPVLSSTMLRVFELLMLWMTVSIESVHVARLRSPTTAIAVPFISETGIPLRRVGEYNPVVAVERVGSYIPVVAVERVGANNPVEAVERVGAYISLVAVAVEKVLNPFVEATAYIIVFCFKINYSL